MTNSAPSHFVKKKVLLEHRMLICLSLAYCYFYTTTKELSIYEGIACKAKILTMLF